MSRFISAGYDHCYMDAPLTIHLHFGIVDVIKVLHVQIIIMDCGCQLAYVDSECAGGGLCEMHYYTALLAGVPRSAN